MPRKNSIPSNYNYLISSWSSGSTGRLSFLRSVVRIPAKSLFPTSLKCLMIIHDDCSRSVRRKTRLDYQCCCYTLSVRILARLRQKLMEAFNVETDNQRKDQLPKKYVHFESVQYCLAQKSTILSSIRGQYIV